ncbi:MAG: hypothetical protein ACYC35_01210 [Pirellulales bacterium]
MLYESAFLTHLVSDAESLRAELWRFFQAAELFARELEPASVPITSVCLGGATWCRGEIKIPIDPSDKGVIFHEVGHSFFEASIFHTNQGGGNNDWWGDAFCDAFRHCMEQLHCPDSPWMRGFPNDRGGRYQYPASLILGKCGTPDGAGLRELWRSLTASGRQQAGFLDGVFDYKMPRP